MTVHITHAHQRRPFALDAQLKGLSQLIGSLLLSLTGWAAPLYAQLNMGISEGEDQVSVARLRSALWITTGLSAGSIHFQSSDVSIKARVDALPVVALGGDLWGTESYGVMFRSELGLGAQLEIPALQDDQTLSYNHTHTLLGGRYRWHLTEGERAPALDLGMGLRWQTESVPLQRPTYFVDRLTLCPAVTLGFQLPLTDQLSASIGGAYSRHLLIREDPADSGEMVGSSALSVQGQVSFMFSALLGVTLQGGYRLDHIEFDGFGTRASGVEDGRSDRGFWNASAGLKVAIR